MPNPIIIGPDGEAVDFLNGTPELEAILARQHDEVRIELDAVEPGILLEEAEPAPVWLRLVSSHGPAGGWPVIEVRGARADVRAYIEQHWGEDAIAVLEEEGDL